MVPGSAPPHLSPPRPISPPCPRQMAAAVKWGIESSLLPVAGRADPANISHDVIFHGIMRRYFTNLSVFLFLLAGGVLPTGLPVASVAQGAGTEAVPADFPAREKGRRARTDGLYGAAERFFLEYRDATRGREPAYTDATTYLIQMQMLQKNLAAAAALLAEYDNRPQLPPNSVYREKLELWRGAVLMAKNEAAAALAVFQAVAERSTDDTIRCQALENVGSANARLNRWPAAEAAYRLIVQQKLGANHDMRVRANLGILKSALAAGQPERCAVMLGELEKAGVPQNILNLYHTLLLLAGEKTTEAWALFQRGMKTPEFQASPDFWMVSGKMAAALAAAHRLPEAREVLANSLAAAATPAEVRQTRLRMVECLIAEDKAEAAITALESFRAEFPGTPELVPVDLKLADILRKSRSFLTAADYYNSLADNERAPAETRYRAAYSQALCLRDADRQAAAATAFFRAAQLGRSDEEKADALHHAAEAAFAAGDYPLAASRYQEVVARFPQLPLAEKSLFNQAVARNKAGNAADAARLFRQFTAAYPTSALVDQARGGLGRALKDAGDYAGAIQELTAFIKELPASPLVPEALLDAQEAAEGNNDAKQAATFLSTLLEDHAASPLATTALYRRCHLHFLHGDYARALADGKRFLDNYQASPLGADVLMWIGDHYLSMGKQVEGEEQYLRLVSLYPASPLAPEALATAGKSAFQRQETDLAAKLVSQLLRDFDKNLQPNTRSQAELLMGDILTSKGNYGEARACFTRAAAAAPETDVAFAASGRLAEMLYTLADEKAENLNQARALFLALAENLKVSTKDREMARYRLAKTYEKLGQQHPDKATEYGGNAKQAYLDVFYGYPLDSGATKIRDWYYFARAGFDVAHLLVMNEDFEQAARIYERLAASGIPESGEANLKAKEIRNAHRLNK